MWGSLCHYAKPVLLANTHPRDRHCRNCPNPVTLSGSAHYSR